MSRSCLLNFNDGSPEIDREPLVAEEIEAQKTVDSGGWWKCMSNHDKILARLAERLDATYRDARDILHTARSGHRNALRRCRRIISDLHEDARPDCRGRCTR